MAPGLRTDAGGGGEAVRCWRSRWSSRGAAAGMLLAAGMLSLLARCAVAAEGESAPRAFSFQPSETGVRGVITHYITQSLLLLHDSQAVLQLLGCEIVPYLSSFFFLKTKPS